MLCSSNGLQFPIFKERMMNGHFSGLGGVVLFLSNAHLKQEVADVAEHVGQEIPDRDFCVVMSRERLDELPIEVIREALSDLRALVHRTVLFQTLRVTSDEVQLCVRNGSVLERYWFRSCKQIEDHFRPYSMELRPPIVTYPRVVLTSGNLSSDLLPRDIGWPCQDRIGSVSFVRFRENGEVDGDPIASIPPFEWP